MCPVAPHLHLSVFHIIYILYIHSLSISLLGEWKEEKKTFDMIRSQVTRSLYGKGSKTRNLALVVCLNKKK